MVNALKTSLTQLVHAGSETSLPVTGGKGAFNPLVAI